MSDKVKSKSPDHGKLNHELEELDLRRAEILKELALKEPVLFPRMVYKDLEGDGDVSTQTNQHTVKSQEELEKYLKDGWKENPEDAVSKEDQKAAKRDQTAQEARQAEVDGKANFGKGPGKGEHDRVKVDHERKTGGQRY